MVLRRIGGRVGHLLGTHDPNGPEPDHRYHHHSQRPVKRQPVQVERAVRIRVERPVEPEHRRGNCDQYDQVLPPERLCAHQQADRGHSQDQVDELDGKRSGRRGHEEGGEVAGQAEPVEGVAVEPDQDQNAGTEYDHQVPHPRRVVTRRLRKERGQQAVAAQCEVATSDGDADRQRQCGGVEDHDQVDDGGEPRPDVLGGEVVQGLGIQPGALVDRRLSEPDRDRVGHDHVEQGRGTHRADQCPRNRPGGIVALLAQRCRRLEADEQQDAQHHAVEHGVHGGSAGVEDIDRVVRLGDDRNRQDQHRGERQSCKREHGADRDPHADVVQRDDQRQEQQRQ